MQRYTVHEAARELGISLSLMYSLLEKRQIRHERHGLGRGKYIIAADALEEYRRRCEVPIQIEPPTSPLPVTHERVATPALDLW